MVQCSSMWYDQIVPGQDLFLHSRSSSSGGDDDNNNKNNKNMYLLISVVFFCSSVSLIRYTGSPLI